MNPSKAPRKSKKAGLTHHGAEWWPLTIQGLKGAFLTNFLFPPSLCLVPTSLWICSSDFWCTQFIFTASSMVSSTKKIKPKKLLCMSQTIHRVLWISRTKHGGDCPEHFLLPWRALLCSSHIGGVEVPGRIQNLFFFTLTKTQILITCLHGRDPGKLSSLLKLVKPSP